MKKRILCAVIAAGMMALSMSACGNDSNTSSTEESTTGSSSESTSTDGESSENTGSSSAIDMEGEPYTVHFMYLNQTEGEAYTAVTEAASALAKEEINMNIDFVPVTFGTYSSTAQMMLAANEPLDLFFNFGGATLPSYIEAGYILNWADYLDQLPDVVDKLGEELNYGYIGDFMAGIGTIGERASTIGLVVRSDIFNELGYTVEDFASVNTSDPASFEKIDELFAAVQQAYPNMTVIAGQQGLSSYINRLTDSLGDGFGVLENFGQTTTVTNWYESDQFKQLVTISKRWYDAHYYSADAATSQDTGETLLKAGNLFSFPLTTHPKTAAEKQSQTGYEVSIIPLNGDGGYTTTSYTAMQYCLANASEDPAKAAAFYNWAFQSGEFEDLIDWGIEGVDWVENEEGFATFPEGVDVNSVGYHNDFGWIYPNQSVGHIWEGNPADVWEQYDAATAKAIKSKAVGFAYDSTAVADQVAACNATLEQYSKSMQFGTMDDVDAAIAEFNDALYSSGLEAIMQEKQSQLDAWLAEQG